tara:strand:- start:267232 stop:269232 length:2001 start_codon:yes stop_codon:yes gene_type:complete
MSEIVRQEIYHAISSIGLVDPHTHINPHAPGSTTLADILGYHYYTELAHSSGMAKSEIEEPGIQPRELVRRLVGGLRHIDNTANYAWLVQLCQKFFGIQDARIDESNWESLYDAAEDRMASAQWSQIVLEESNVEAVFLTNDFDDPLDGFDTQTYIPCLRTDDLVFHLAKPETQVRLAASTGVELDGSLGSLRDALQQRFEHFVSRGARACAISIPPTFQPTRVSDGRAGTALDHVLSQNLQADPAHIDALSRRVFWTLAELCDEYSLPFDLMIGVNRGVYQDGVYQGQDLYDSRVSLTQYAELFNAFPDVKFPISVLASVTNQELVSHAWIFPNVYTNGHWWYSNTPSFISRDANARLEAVPRNKQVAYYSDAYKLEFVWPKFDMYRQVLARVLTDHFVVGSGWSEEQAIDLARQVLRGNVDTIFRRPGETVQEPPSVAPAEHAPDAPGDEPESSHTEESAGLEDTIVIEPQVAAATSALAAGAIGMIQVDESPAEPESREDVLSVDPSSDDGLESASQDASEIGDDEDAEGTADEGPVVDLEETWAESEDPLPTDDEIAEVDAADVELREVAENLGGTPAVLDAEAIEVLADDEALDVGDLMGEQDDDEPQIQMLEGDSSFSPDEDSLQLKPDPTTGEWTMRPDETAASGEDDDEFVLDEPDEE